MNDLTCEKCGKLVDESAVFCPHCGAAILRAAPVTPSAPPPRSPAPAQTPTEEPPEKFDYKKLLPPAAVVLAVILALILGWDTLAGIFGPGEGPPLSTQPSTQQTVPSTAAPTTAPTKPRETTAPTEPPTVPSLPTPPETEPAPTEPDLSWYVENLQYMSYQDFFSVERKSSGTLQPLVWTDPDGHECALVANNGFQIFRKSDSKYVYVIPNSESLADSCTVIGTNGKYAYLHNATQILQLELLTGEVTELFTFDEILSYELPFRELCYITAEMNDTLSLCRLHLPTLTLDVLYDGIPARTPRGWLSISFPSSTQGTINWQGISPEMVDALYAEFSNPDSKYRNKFYVNYAFDHSKYWEDPELIRQLSYSLEGTEPMAALQNDMNLQALWKGTYSIADGTVTQDWGVVDTCWFGSGYGHDHWNPELTADIPPTVLNAEAIPVPGMVSPSEEMAAAIRQETYDDGNKLYKTKDTAYGNVSVLIYADGEYQEVSGLPLVKKGQYLRNCKYYSYYISADDTLIRLDLGGSASVIYTAKHGELKRISYDKGNLYFIDGNTIVMLDTVACTSRELLTHPGSINMYYDEGNKLYITTTLGMAINAYLFDYTTGVLEETRYRL